ncbi:MAG: AMP-dependent acyl-CoA synthetase [Leptothrix sp. (in: Bacteria)]|nr:AMP-dependent acyl-CoA synthetase [Leptothrix sp. (in: b-proteobacteria)]
MIAFVSGHDAAATAIVDAATGARLSRAELVQAVSSAAAQLRSELGRGLVFHLADNSVASVVLYLACLEAGCPVALLEPAPAERLSRLLDAFAPDAVLLPAGHDGVPGYGSPAVAVGSTYRLGRRQQRQARELHAGLALLLTTSGSTGSPKLVRLSLANLEANARSIVEYLDIPPSARSAQTLPMHYSYGLSLINSHLLAGATVVLSPWSFLQREFWAGFDATGCTAIAGVPYIYETLHRLRFDPAKHPTLRTLTQAGGALRGDVALAMHERAAAAGARFHVMYGQTEATARISHVPPERLVEKIGSIGIAIPRGRLTLAPLEGHSAGELVYDGPNVMLGYAETAADLALGDVQMGCLLTGDLAEADDDGYFFLRGRLKRFAKLFGKRVSLEDVEREVERAFPVSAAVVQHGDGLRIVASAHPGADGAALALQMTQQVARSLRVPPAAVRVAMIDALPLTASGKKDYQALSE